MAGRLTVHRPTPTTASFTVSNAPRRSNPTAKVLFGLQILLRALLFFCVIGVGVARLRRQFFEQGSFLTISWQDVWSSPAGDHVCQLVDSYNPSVLVVVGGLVLYGVFRRGYTGELAIQSPAPHDRLVLIFKQRNHFWSFEDSVFKLPPRPPPTFRQLLPDSYPRPRFKTL